MASSPPVPGRFVPRHVDARVRAALADTRIVAVVGPRQSGKTTLVRRIAADRGLPFVTLDDELSRRFALNDPTGFLRAFPVAAIDELQRAPRLILALKQTVDEDPHPGRYIVTGSVDLFRSAISPDSLAGRVETLTLLPFSQAEIAGQAVPGFLNRAFEADFPRFESVGYTEDLLSRILTGGYPEAVGRPTATRRRAWLRAYANSLARRDVAPLFRVSKIDQMAGLVAHTAVRAGQLLNRSRLGAELGIDAKTVDRWLVLLEDLFLVRRIRAWSRNDLKRLTKSPKLQLLDSGLLAAVTGVTRATIDRDRSKVGPLLECFAYSEILKACGSNRHEVRVSHYRDKDKVEVDLVLERGDGSIVGIEVKGSSTATPKDCRGLGRLKTTCGDRFACGILLHDGDRIQEVSPSIFVIPAKMLWEP